MGYAEYQNGKTSIQVKDDTLKKILQSPYNTKKGEKTNNVFVTYKVQLQPGTYEHLRAIGIEIFRFGYASKMMENKRP